MRCLALIAAMMMAAPAMAQDRMTPEQCSGSWGAVAELTGLPAGEVTAEPDNEGWCEVEGYSVQGSDQQVWQIATLRWRATDIARLIEHGLPPRALDVQGRGLQMYAQTGDPVLDYALALQAEPMVSEFGIAVRWDGLKNSVVVDEAYLRFDESNRIAATLRLEGVNLTDNDTMTSSLATMGLRDLTVTADFDGWFERLAVLPVAMWLLERGDTPPAAQVDALKAQAIAALDEVSDATVPEASRTALAGFIDALPMPRGAARVQIAADPVFDAARLTQSAVLLNDASEEEIGAALAGITVLFNWTPAGPKE